ncbi:MAG: hypothetical protein U1B79_00860 [Candidatus Pacearchaeota archaeon]|nr:hypothetical protein [Nanoarchaeota archaeon]MDZ4226642.1 hypothetical protein [Candidatus Pacearchaeota archaeon]
MEPIKPYVGMEVKYVDVKSIIIVEISSYEIIDSEEEFGFIPREIEKDDTKSFERGREFKCRRPMDKESLEWSLLRID